MIQASGVIICLGYILGLLLSAVPWGGFLGLFLSIVGAVWLQRYRVVLRKARQTKTSTRKKIPEVSTVAHPRVLLIAGLVALISSFYFQFRLPQPQANDISNFIPPGNSSNQEQLVIVRGEVTSTPRLTRSGKGQLWLNTTQLSEVKNEAGPANVSKGVSGKLYVTLPILQSTGLYPQQQIEITGFLYKPKVASNPGGFDFKKYLQTKGAFAGLSGQRLNIIDDERKWGWWRLRSRIVRSLVSGLGIPNGLLVSAMVLGSKAVDLPYDIRDLFIQGGLAHTIAASGFHVSLILSLVLALTKRFTKKTQFILGSLALIIFICLTGFSPSVLRAVIMGFAVLIGIGLQRQVKQLGSLLVAATILLLINPVWIWDLGFQLSFLATLGLIVTVPGIIKRCSWLPPAIASLIAVPLAATIWTLPVQLYTFGVVPTYGILLNIIATPLVSLISLGGIMNALVASAIPLAGSALANISHYPTELLINLVKLFTTLPGNSVAVGKIEIWQLLIVYTLIILTWQVRWWQRKWWLALILAMSLVLIPFWHSANTLFRIVVLAAGSEPVLVIQDQGKVAVVNSGDEEVGRYTLLPFLQQQGVNQIDLAIASNFAEDGSQGWLEILPRMPIKFFYEYSPDPQNALNSQALKTMVEKKKGIYKPLSVAQTVNAGTVVAQLINDQLPLLQMRIRDQLWLFVGNLKPTQLSTMLKNSDLPRPNVLWCSSKSLKELVVALQPQVAIAPSTNFSPQELAALTQSRTQLFFTGQDGAVEWTPKRKFEAFVQSTENKASVL